MMYQDEKNEKNDWRLMGFEVMRMFREDPIFAPRGCEFSMTEPIGHHGGELKDAK